MSGLTDREELVELLARYASIADTRDFDELPATVFTDRVICDFESVGAGPPIEIERDVFLHRWDLARATGQDERLDPDKCAAMLEGMLPMDEALRQSGHYGPRVHVPDDADVQTKLLAFIGRTP